MAYVSMGILLFHRVVSSLAVLLTTERNYKRAFLQFCDLLILEEIIFSIKKTIVKITSCLSRNNDDENRNLTANITS